MNLISKKDFDNNSKTKLIKFIKQYYIYHTFYKSKTIF